MILLWMRMCFNAEGAANGADTPPTPPATPATAPAPAPALAQHAVTIATGLPPVTDAAGEGSPAAYIPAGIPEALRGANERETLDRIAADFANRPQPPDKPGAYELKLSDEVKAKFGDMSEDPVLPMWRETAHELGLSNEQFSGAFEKLYTRMAEAGLVDDPINIDNELQRLEPASGDTRHKTAAAAQRVNAAVNWVEGLLTRNALSQGEAAELAQVAATANGVMALEKLMRLADHHGLQGGGDIAPTGDTLEGLRALMKDPRYDLRGPQGDRNFVADVDTRYRRLHTGR